MMFWLETDLKKRTDSHETYYNYCGIVKNHIIPILGKKKMTDVTRGDVQKLFNIKADYSRPIAEQVKTIMNVSFRYAVTAKVIPTSPVDGIGLPKAEKPQKGRVSGNELYLLFQLWQSKEQRVPLQVL